MTPTPTPVPVHAKGCILLPGAFGAFVQLLLAACAISVLLLKRTIERPQRRWLVWGFDASKQLASGLCAHFVAIGVSILVNHEEAGGGDQCSCYLLTFVLDTTLGVAIALLLTRVVEKLSVWCLATVAARFIVGLTMLLSRHVLVHVAQGISGLFKGRPRQFLLVVMILCPLGMNGLQFWVQDVFLKFARRRRGLSSTWSDDDFDGLPGDIQGNDPEEEEEQESLPLPTQAPEYTAGTPPTSNASHLV
eukprot:gene3109-3649_t